MTEKNKDDVTTTDDVMDQSGIMVSDHLLVRDVDTSEVLASVRGTTKQKRDDE